MTGKAWSDHCLRGQCAKCTYKDCRHECHQKEENRV